jgi:hypothetical protein
MHVPARRRASKREEPGSLCGQPPRTLPQHDRAPVRERPARVHDTTRSHVRLRVQELGQLLSALVRGFSPVRESAVEYSQELEHSQGARRTRSIRSTAHFEALRALLRPYLSGPIGPVLPEGAAWGREGRSPRVIGLPNRHLSSPLELDKHR